MGSGGGSSGKSDYPQYMKDMHQGWLGEMDTLVPTTNPYTGVVAYDPGTPISNLSTYLTNFTAYFLSIGRNITALKSLWSAWVTLGTSGITDAMTAALDVHGIPEFEGGMRDINAVQTSSFALGKSMLYARVGLEAAKLALLNANQSLELSIKYGEALRGEFATLIDAQKIIIIAYKEQKDMQIELDVEEAKWVFFNWREAGALLGAIGGPGGLGSSAKPNPMASALGGAVAGAAAGAAFGGVGAIAGAVIGGVGGYLSAS